MKAIVRFCLSLFAVLVASNASRAKASQWIDPTWEQMIRDATVIGLFEVTEGGLNQGKVKKIRLLKGELATEEIPLAGFNDLYWPEDAQQEHALRKGEQLYLFLSTAWVFRSEARGIEPDLEKITTEHLFVPSPTAGILALKSGKVGYSLFATSYSWARPERSAEDFEALIRNAVAFQQDGAPDEEALALAVKGIRAALEEAESEEGPSQLGHSIALYRLWGGSGLIDEMARAIQHFDAAGRYQAAQLIGGELPDPKAKQWLIGLLDDTHPMVQGRAVSHLRKLKGDEEIGRVFTEKLATALPGRVGPANIMSPVLNAENGGLLELIDAIAELGVKDAEDELAAVMKGAEDETVLRAAFRALARLNSDAWVEPLRHHLKSANDRTLTEAVDIAAQMQRSELREDLERLLAETDPGDYVVNRLIPALGTRESLPAIQRWIEDFITRNDPGTWDGDRCSEIIEILAEFDPEGSRDLIERLMFYWSGIDGHFVEHQELLEIRRRLEADTRERISQAAPKLAGKEIEVRSRVLLNNRAALASGESSDPDFWMHADLIVTPPSDEGAEIEFSELDELRQAVADQSGIAVEAIGIKYQVGNSSWRVANTDDRAVDTPDSDLIRAYIRFIEASDDAPGEKLLQFYLDSGIAAELGWERQIKKHFE